MPARIFLHKHGPSTGAMDLRHELRRLGHEVRFVNMSPRTDVVINWGSHNVPAFRGTVINSGNAVRTATSKRASYQAFAAADVPTCGWTNDRAQAVRWGATQRVIGRDADHGSGGAGTVVYEAGTPIGEHRFYVRYFRKQREFRVHVYKGVIVRVLEKLKKRNFEGRDQYIRSHLRGWVFGSNHLATNPAPNMVSDLAVRAVAALGLDFGGVDVGYNTHRDAAIVFEVNTAPGLEGTSATLFAQAIHNDLG